MFASLDQRNAGSMYRDLNTMVSNEGNLYRTVPVVNDTAVYFFEDAMPCCADCANGENGSLASIDSDDPQWRIVGYLPAQEYLDGRDELPQCTHCGEPVAEEI